MEIESDGIDDRRNLESNVNPLIDEAQLWKIEPNRLQTIHLYII
jgi:hypothetical protein